MTDKKSTSRIVDEMDETMRGLHRCGALSTRELEKFIKHIEEKAKQDKSFDPIKFNKF
ncbi:hypothetical protein [Polynucleobacter sp. AM-25C3]|jgi:hypothetical protein|uniref:hypothetical protein n=1 Tax=Polynucleobacter sp. AM-25C3 TaxID=1855569 RepID=UPI001C0CADBC|nr:hypothetical protein [Polynucleobacter sp. AM-25C3]MBU3601734.1 hypothetical protein [Polynucleobacter sp. AM-25C3]